MAVYGVDANKSESPIAFVRVCQAGALRASVEPCDCEYQGKMFKRVTDLPDGAPCESGFFRVGSYAGGRSRGMAGRLPPAARPLDV